jgi:hypothetical protein
VVEIEDLPGRTELTGLKVVIAQIGLIHHGVMAVLLVVGQFVDGVTRVIALPTLVFLVALAMIVGFLYENPPTLDANRFYWIALGIGVVVVLGIAATGAVPLLGPASSLLVLALVQMGPATRKWVRTPLRQSILVAVVLLVAAVPIGLSLSRGSSELSWTVLVFRVVTLGAPTIALAGLGGSLGHGNEPYSWAALATLTFAAIPAVFVDLSSPPGGMGLVQFFLPLFGMVYAVVGVAPILLGYAGTSSAGDGDHLSTTTH